jgi:hypothetical protein
MKDLYQLLKAYFKKQPIILNCTFKNCGSINLEQTDKGYKFSHIDR